MKFTVLLVFEVVGLCFALEMAILEALGSGLALRSTDFFASKIGSKCASIVCFRCIFLHRKHFFCITLLSKSCEMIP